MPCSSGRARSNRSSPFPSRPARLAAHDEVASWPYRLKMLLAVCHSEETGWTDVSDLDTLSDLRQKPGNLLWAEADVTTLGEAEVLLIAEEFGLHPLAVEDAIHTRQRPKLDIYETHAFAVVHELDEIE